MAFDWKPTDDEWFANAEPDLAPMVYELGGRAFSWLQNVNAYEINPPDDILTFIPGSSAEGEHVGAYA